MAPLLKEFVQQSNGKVKLKFINHPLDMICNKNMSNQLHQGACEIAQGTFCANLQGKFWQYHDEIFAIQKHQISRKDILEKASIAGIELNQFEKCLTSKQAEKAIVDEIAEGDRLDIKGTPTIFINGKIYKFAIHPLILLKIVEAELKN
jgi:protein-disulfide isomerase